MKAKRGTVMRRRSMDLQLEGKAGSHM